MPRRDLIQVRRGTAAQWATANPVLAAGEIGEATDTGVLKAGNGADPWLSLPSPGTPVTDGVGAVFFGGVGIQVPITNTATFCPFIASDDPPRAPQRDDLIIVDPEDETTLNVVRTGLYDISMNTPVGLNGLTYDLATNAQVIGDVQFSVNGANEPPTYDYNNRAYWQNLIPGVESTTPVALNLTFPQELHAGDTCQLQFKATQSGLGHINDGYMTMYPDLTMVCTYRGPVAA